jgi:hypothetical protein
VIREGKKTITSTIFSVCAINSSILNVRLVSLNPIKYVRQNLKDKDGIEIYNFLHFSSFYFRSN